MGKGVPPLVRELAIKGVGEAHRRYSRLALPQPPQYIFLLSHMRARTSLLSHILGSSPEIGGYVEQHMSYRAPKHMQRLHWRYVVQTRSVQPRRYLYDKMLNVKLDLGESVIALPESHFLFMLRSPIPTIKSIVTILPHYSLAKAVDYYLTRLEQLECMAEKMHTLGKSFLYLDADDLVQNTAQTFSRIEQHLALRTPLSEDYNVGRFTGMDGGYGDISENIKQGRILRKPSSTHSELLVKETAEQCQQAYDHARESISALSSSSAGPMFGNVPDGYFHRADLHRAGLTPDPGA